MVKRSDEAESIEIVKTRTKSSFGVPLSTVSKRKSPPAACSPIRASEDDAAKFIVRGQEESAFPGFNISTMARQKIPRNVLAPETFAQKAELVKADIETEVCVEEFDEKEAIEIAPEMPELSEAETLALLAPAARDRMRVAGRTGRLDLAGLKIGFIPTAISGLDGLQQLTLAANGLVNLGFPQPLARLTRLLELDLSNNDLSFHESISLPASLTNLSLRDNALLALPQASLLAQLPHLSGLDVRYNLLRSLAPLSSCGALEELLASHNALQRIGDNALSVSLRSLDASFNAIRSVDANAFASLFALERLILKNNRLVALSAVAGLQRLTSLDLSFNMLITMGPEFGQLSRLQSLRARGNAISSVEFSFAQLPELRLVDLSYNRLATVPASLLEATSLRTIMLSCNMLGAESGLSKLDWTRLPALTVFMCAGNELSVFPEALCRHSQLAVLYLGYNRLTETNTLTCPELKILNLSGNPDLRMGKELLVSAERNPKLVQLLVGSTLFGERDLADIASGYSESLKIVFGKAPEERVVGCAELVGLRPAMEDRTVVSAMKNGGKLFSVFDGHGGAQGAEVAARAVVGLVEQHCFAGNNEKGSNRIQVEKGLRKVFAELDQTVGEACLGGATCVMALLTPDARGLTVANVGDARAVLLRSGKDRRLSRDHRLTDPEERKRVHEAGGVVINGRLDGIIEVTRALGDPGIPLCLAQPHVCSLAVQSGDVLILACDGVFDEMTDAMVVHAALRYPDNAELAAQMICDQAFFLGSTDNVSVLVANL